MISFGIENVTFWLETKSLNQLYYHMPKVFLESTPKIFC
jgi:hypothetical protein